MQYNKCPVCDTSMIKGAKCKVCGYSESTDYQLHKTLGPIGYEISTIQKNIEYKKRTSDAVEKKHQEELEVLKRRLAEVEAERQLEKLRKEEEERAQEEARLREAKERERQAEDEKERQLEAEHQRKALEEEKRKLEEERKEADRRREAEKQRKEQNREKETSKGDKRKLGMIGGGLVALAAVVLIAGKLLGGSGTEGVAQTESNNETGVKVGDTITFGHYEQDNNEGNGEEAIEWNVLAIEDGKALIQSVYGLWAEAYSEEYEGITWEECTLRTSLNGNFYNNAFDAEEKEQIEKTEVKAEKNSGSDTSPGKDTEDYVFLLSIQEAEKYYISSEARKCRATEYAKANGAYVNDYTKCSWWWLRSPGYSGGDAAGIDSAGWADWRGDGVDTGSDVVRPALWINL